LSKKLGYSNASFIVQMTGPNPTREVTEKTARKIEQTLDLPIGWLDHQNNGHNGDTLSTVDVSLVSKVTRVVAQHAEDERIRMTPEKLGNMVALVYSDAQSHGNNIRQEFVKFVIQLVK